MKTITRKEYYDKIMAAVESGVLPSVDFENKMWDKVPICKYRHGTSCCVAGLLIEDCNYTPEMEGRTIIAVADRWPEAITKVEGMSIWDLREIQQMHDMQFRLDDNGKPGQWNKQKFIDDINNSMWFKEFAPVAVV